jgi:hypothetical protein
MQSFQWFYCTAALQCVDVYTVHTDFQRADLNVGVLVVQHICNTPWYWSLLLAKGACVTSEQH